MCDEFGHFASLKKNILAIWHDFVANCQLQKYFRSQKTLEIICLLTLDHRIRLVHYLMIQNNNDLFPVCTVNRFL